MKYVWRDGLYLECRERERGTCISLPGWLIGLGLGVETCLRR